MLGLLLFILVCAAEKQVHGEDLPCNEKGEEKSGVVLGQSLKFTQQFEQKSTVVNNFCEEHHLEKSQYCQVATDIANERVVKVGEQNTESMEPAALKVKIVKRVGLCGLCVKAVAAEDVEEKNDDEGYQCPRNEEAYLWLEEDQLYSVFFKGSLPDGQHSAQD